MIFIRHRKLNANIHTMEMKKKTYSLREKWKIDDEKYSKWVEMLKAHLKMESIISSTWK